MATKGPLPYYKWFWRDWRSNRRVQRMTPQARAIYRELLDEFWAEGILPADMPALAEASGWPLEEFTKFWPEIESSWVLTERGLIHPTLSEQRAAMVDRQAKASKAGLRGAIALHGEIGEERSPSMRPTSAEWNSLRELVFRRDDYTCQYCFVRGGRLECDHVIPVARGGSSSEKNLVTACLPCNRS